MDGTTTASYRSPMTIYIKNRWCRFYQFIAKIGSQIQKINTLWLQRNQLSYKYPKLLLIQHFMWMAQQQHHAKAPWHLYQKSWLPSLPVNSQDRSKIQKSGCIVTKSVTCVPNCNKSNILYWWHYYVIIQMSHDHLYQKSRRPGPCSFKQR